jgi:glycosyltransferase involved in cell wall biosynthesis
MRRLAIIPNDPIDLYLSSGYGANWLKSYFNPNRYFDEVFSLAPYEKVDGSLVGVTVVPTAAEDLPRRLCELNIDVVRAYGGSHPCDIACGNRVNGVPVVVSVHDTAVHMLHPSIAEADVVLCMSDAVRRLVATKFRRHERTWILPNRVDFDVMRRRSPEETAHLDAIYPFKHRILHVGRRSRQKNLDNLIKALRFLGPEYCLIASGKGPLDEYTSLATHEGVRDRCFFLDAIANEELPLYLSWATCMCNPSRWEGFGIVFIEALATGAVVVASDTPPISELIQHGENGLLVEDYENPEAIAAMIGKACTDHGVRKILTRNARRSVEQFERSRIDALEAGYYQRVLDLRKAGAFEAPVMTQIRRSVGRQARVFPRVIRQRLNSFIGR